MAYYQKVERGGLGSYSPMVQRGGLGEVAYYALCADTDPYSTGFCDDGTGNIISRGDWNPILTQPNPVTPPLPPTTTDTQGVPIVGVQQPVTSQTPPITDGTYTLPVEVFSHQLPPITIPVTAPEPTMAPIPTTLPASSTTMIETGASIGLLLVAAIGLWMLSAPKRRK